MSWHYACVKREAEFGEGYEYHLVEAYPQLAGWASTDKNTIPYAESVHFIGESPSELAAWLRMAADDIEKHGEIPVFEEL